MSVTKLPAGKPAPGERQSGQGSSGGGPFLENFRGQLHAAIDRALTPLTRTLAGFGVEPNHVTVLGTAICLLSPLLILSDHLVLAGMVWLFGSAFDLVDGALARYQKRLSTSGAFLDSTFDRISEGAIFAAIAYYFAANDQPATAALTALALLGALLISYTRARAEALGAACKVGIITRAERVLLIGSGLCFGVLEPAIYLLVALSAISTAQRIQYVLRALTERS